MGNQSIYIQVEMQNKYVHHTRGEADTIRDTEGKRKRKTSTRLNKKLFSMDIHLG